MNTIIIFALIGFFAQIIDGAIGMAYGVISTSILLGMGIPPAAASASVHTSEVVTTFVSGLSHLKFNNIDKKLLYKLIIPGVAGGVLGAYILTQLPGEKIKPFIAIYLLIMGLVIIWKAFKKVQEKKIKDKLIPLALAGGFFDATGGGGWGPIVTSTLVARGNNPKLTIGSVNASEFFITASEVATFTAILGLMHWDIIFGLMIGGVIAAPLAAYVCKKIPTKKLMIVVGILIIITSARTIYLSF